MTAGVRPGGGSRSERALLERVAGHFVARGWVAYVDPDGTSYFDLAVRRDAEVGLVEGKVGGARNVLDQAIRRRAWADWVAVALDAPRAAERLCARTRTSRASVVGVLLVGPEGVTELRAPISVSSDDDAFAPLRARFRSALEEIDRGDRPTGVGWGGVATAVRRASGGRRFAGWRLDELERRPAQLPPTSVAATRSGSKRDA